MASIKKHLCLNARLCKLANPKIASAKRSSVLVLHAVTRQNCRHLRVWLFIYTSTWEPNSETILCRSLTTLACISVLNTSVCSPL